MSNMPIERIDRRKLERRLANHGINDLLNTFSSSHCHTCLDRIGNGVLLLDNEMRVTYATPQVEQILKKHNPAILLQPKFTLPPSKQADHLSAFANEKKRETDLLNLLLEAKNGIDLLLLICVRLPKPVDMEIYTNHYMITLRDSKYYPSTQWQTFRLNAYRITFVQCAC